MSILTLKVEILAIDEKFIVLQKKKQEIINNIKRGPCPLTVQAGS